MGIPTRQDHALGTLETLHSVVMVRCRAFVHAGKHRDPGSIRTALQAYADAVVGFVNETVDR